MSNFDKILEQIENQNIEPTPKWYFQLKAIWILALFLLSVIIGSISFSIILYSIQQTDFVLIEHLKHSKLETFLVLLPYFWLITLLIFSILAFFSFKNFKKAYKYSFTSILTASIFISILVGTLLFISGGAQLLENKFATKVQIYKSVEEKKLQHWMNPTDGFLSGTITDAKQDTIYLMDFNQKKWTILYHDVFIPPVIDLTEGENIKIVGNQLDDKTFEAMEIRPWRSFGSKKMLKKGKNN